MKKSSLIACGAAVAALALGSFGFMACQTEPEKEEKPTPAETITFSNTTNPFNVSWEEVKERETEWTSKADNLDDIYYQFEGSYSEAYQENYSRSFMVLNCYKDGIMYGTFGSDSYYGYWTNVDRRGNPLVVLHVLCFKYNGNISEYNSGGYDVIFENMSHDYYEYSTNMPIVMWGNQMRSCLVSGTHYSKPSGLKVSGGQTVCILDDSFSKKGLEVVVEYENGKSMKMDAQWYDETAGTGGLTNCPIKFSGFDSSKKGNTEVTLNYANTDVTAKYTCAVKGLKSIKANAKDATVDYYLGDGLDTSALVVNATLEDDSSIEVATNRYKVEGYDTTKLGEQTITVNFDGKGEYTDTYKVTVSEPTYQGTGYTVKIKSLEVNQQNRPVGGTCELTTGGKTGTLAYTVAANAGENIYTISKADGVTGGFTDAEIADLHKEYILDRAAFAAYRVGVYTLNGAFTADAAKEPNNGDGTKVMIVNQDTKQATYVFSYKMSFGFWSFDVSLTYVVKCTIEGNVVTFTEEISHNTGFGGGPDFEDLQMKWTLGNDGTASRAEA